MRTTRTVMGGLVAGLGTSGSVVAASACLFFVASTMIAFNSWSGSDLSGKIESLFVGGGSRSVNFDVPGPQIVAANASAAAAGVARTAGGAPSGRGADTGAGAGGDLGASPAPEQAAPVTGGGSSPVDDVPTIVASPAPEIGVSLPDLSQVTAAGVPDASLGRLAESTTDALGGTVEQTTGLVGSTVDGLGLPFGDVVTSTGQTLGGVVSGTGQTLGGVLNGLNGLPGANG